MTNHRHFPFPLGELLHLLKAKGYDVSIENVMQLQSVLLSSSALHTKPRELKYILGPLLAKNEEEQADLYRLVDDYIDAKTKEKMPLHKRFWQRMLNKKNTLWVKLAALVLVIITAVIFYFVQSSGTRTNDFATTPSDSIKTNQQPASPQQVKSNPDSLNTIDTTGVDEKTGGIKLNITYAQPLTTERTNLGLQLALLLGVSLGAILFNILFNEKRKLMDKEEGKKKVQSENFDKEELTRVDYGMQAQPKHIELEPVGLTFPSKNYLIRHSNEFIRIKAALKKPVIIEGQRLNIHKSIYATTRKAGFVSVVFDEQSKRRKIVALIERIQESQMTQLFDYFIHFLQSEKLHVRKFYYNDDISKLTDEAGKPHTLNEISEQYRDHDLLVLGSGRNFFNVGSELKRNLASPLRNWPGKYLVTPTPFKDWNEFEDNLAKQGFQVVPAEIEAIELMTATMLDQSVVVKSRIFQKIKHHYSVESFDLNSAAGIREYLDDEDLFQLVCSLAIYPRLDWNLTLTLMVALGERKRQELLDYNTLLKIARIPCLQETELKPALRLELLHRLKPVTEVKARETIVKILKDIKPQLPKSSLAYAEMDVQLNLNAFFLYAHDEWEYQAYSYTRDAISDYWDSLEDWVMKERVEQQLSGIMPLNSMGKPQTVDEYMIKEKEIEVQQLRLSKAYVLMLPALMLYILFFIFKPDFVYGAVKKVSIQAVIQKDPSCTGGFNYVEIYGDRITSLPLEPSAQTENVEIKDVDPERSLTIKLIGKNTFEEVMITPKYGIVTIGVKCE